MDNIFDRAHDLIDKAQEKVASATSQAAWTANQTLVIKNLEGQLGALQTEIDRVTVDLGNRTYMQWKASADDARIPGLCRHLDDLKARWTQVHADLATARAATYDPRVIQSSWQNNIGSAPSVTVAPPQQLAPPVQSAPAPQPAPAQPMPQVTQAQPAPQPAPRTAAPPPAPPVQSQPAAPPARPRPAPAVQPQPAAQAAPRAQEPPRPAPQPRECPNCGHFVGAGIEYCPSCGLRVT